jgi:hypothetical protein
MKLVLQDILIFSNRSKKVNKNIYKISYKYTIY